MTRNFGLDHQGKREDQVSFAELVAGICFGLMLVCLLGLFFLWLAG